MRRRSVLAALGAAIPLAGCTTTRQPGPLAIGETAQLRGNRTITISKINFRRLLFDPYYPDDVVVLGRPDRQFVFLTVPVGSDANTVVPSPDSFRLLLDDKSYHGQESVGGASIDARLETANEIVHPTPPTAAKRGLDKGSVGFALPLDVSPGTVIVEWQGDDAVVQWAWSDADMKALSAPPTFRVSDIDHPDAFQCEIPFDITANVVNRGGRDSEFVATLRAVDPVEQYPPKQLIESVSAGSQSTLTSELQFPPMFPATECGEDTGEVTFQLDWALGTREFTINRR
jgi:hypothetical protein